jgi:hypothetical protein
MYGYVHHGIAAGCGRVHRRSTRASSWIRSTPRTWSACVIAHTRHSDFCGFPRAPSPRCSVGASVMPATRGCFTSTKKNGKSSEIPVRHDLEQDCRLHRCGEASEGSQRRAAGPGCSDVKPHMGLYVILSDAATMGARHCEVELGPTHHPAS